MLAPRVIEFIFALSLQIEVHKGSKILVGKVDSVHGFAWTRRDAIWLHLSFAGTKSGFWLLADACMQTDRLRVRVGV